MTHTTEPGCCDICRARVGIMHATTLAKATLDAGLPVIASEWRMGHPSVQVYGIDALTAAAAISAPVIGHKALAAGTCDEATVEWGDTTATIVGTVATKRSTADLDRADRHPLAIAPDEHPSPTAVEREFDGCDVHGCTQPMAGGAVGGGLLAQHWCAEHDPTPSPERATA